MGEYQVAIAGVCLLVSTLVIVVLRVHEPAQTSGRAQRRQMAAAERVLAGGSGSSLSLDWMHFKAVPKEALVGLASKHGWHHVGDDTAGRTWMLHFGRAPRANR